MMNFCKFTFMDLESAAIAAKEYQARVEFLSDEFFNLPNGWSVTYHNHYEKARFSLFDTRKRNKQGHFSGFLVELRNGVPVPVEFRQVTTVDWYIVSQRFGGNDAPF